MKTPDKKQNKNTDSPEEFFKDKFDYDPKEDIYNQGKKVAHIDNDDELVVDKGIPTPNDRNELYEEAPLHNAKSNFEGETIDVPGAELDDQQESIGSEDEENNYYSLGGDNHSN
ncbi:hypothetical protein V9L05_21245 [Bernardetia sp. Wsw4-3y2]|uniref:hypothetical protein n=1 Tax=Bernardetia sp. Wsw4-3y2 TaxID=3127471 RepID=UPI0030D30954